MSLQSPQPAVALGQPATNTLAVVSLVFGIVSWFALPFVGALVAIIVGHLARKQIRLSNGAEGGDGLALTGLILGYVHVALSCLVITGFALFFGVLAANAH